MSDNEEENSDHDNRLDKIERDELVKRISEEENRLQLEKEKLMFDKVDLFALNIH